jgi:protein O-mannosyl-transferase
MKPEARHPVKDLRTQYWLLGLLLVGLTVIVYQPAWNAGFIWDDDDYVTHNPLLTAPDGLKRIWFSLDSPSQYFPLTYTTFRIERSLWALNASAYHWVNILLHSINALLVWGLLKRLKIPGAWLAAAIFALHPVNVESVAWISELKNVQSMFFSLLSLLAWVRFVDAGQNRWRWYGLTLLFYALALFSKTTACTLPVALLLILWLQRKPIRWSRVVQIVPFLLMGVAMGLVSMWWERHHQGTEGELYSIPLLERILVASRAIWFYLGKLLWPAGLTFNYPLWKINVADPLAYVWLVAAIGMCGLIFYVRRFIGRGVEVAMVYYVATLGPLLGFIMLYTFRYTFVADHYQYPAGIGPIALVAAGLTWWANKNATASGTAAALRRSAPESAGGPAHSTTWRTGQPPFFQIASITLLIALGVLTWRQCGMYRDLETLWRATLVKNSGSFMAHNNLGAILLGKGQVDDAIAHFQKALEILPDHANAHGNLGNAFLQKGRPDEALAHFQKAVELEPNSAKAHSDLGFGLLQKGRVDDAIVHTRKALELQPDFVEGHSNLGWALVAKGKPDEALGHFQKAVELQPDSADNCYNLGTVWLHNGRPDEAIRFFRRALGIRPDFAKAHNNLGSALLQTGQTAEAILCLQKALAIQPDNLEARNNLGWILLQNGRVDEAISQFQSVLKLQPDFVGAHYNLGSGFFQLGRLDEAMAEFQKVLELQPDNVEVRNNLGWIQLQSGRTDEAIANFEVVLKAQPDFPLVRGNLAVALLRQGRANDAIAQYQSFLKLEPNNPAVLSELAWILATWPEENVRNGAQAVELAGRANELSGGKDAGILRALAAAYAENGKFAEAVATARRAKDLAESQSNTALRDALQSQLQLYESGAPFRDSSPTNSTSRPIQH